MFKFCWCRLKKPFCFTPNTYCLPNYLLTKAYQHYPCSLKHAPILSIYWENVSVLSFVMIMLTSHPTFISLLAHICKSASECPATKALHLYRKWSSQSCRLRPHIQLPWQPIRQRAMVHAASPNWSPPLAQVTWPLLLTNLSANIVDDDIKLHLCSVKLWNCTQWGLKKHQANIFFTKHVKCEYSLIYCNNSYPLEWHDNA